MSKVTQDLSGAVPLEDTPKDEEEGVNGNDGQGSSEAQGRHQKDIHRNRNFAGMMFALVAIALIIGLSVGLTQNKEGEDTTNTAAPKFNSNNLAIFDKAVALIESTPRHLQELPNGETISYREYNMGQSHVLVMLPGYLCDDTLFSIIAVLPEFRDHHIIAVNPLGWNGSSMKTPITSHEENADLVVDLLKAMGIKEAMVGGYSTGGGIAFHMAQKYPDMISAAFLFHSIPLNGYKVFDESGKPVIAEDMATSVANLWPDDMADDHDALYEQLKLHSSNPAGLPSPEHSIFAHLAKAVNMPGKKEAMINNVNFNVSPIKTPYAEPSEALSTLKSKVVVIHGSKDIAVAAEQVELVTKLAIVEHWAPPNKLFFYDDGQGHFLFLDNPTALASVYREAFEEQILHSESV